MVKRMQRGSSAPSRQQQHAPDGATASDTDHNTATHDSEPLCQHPSYATICIHSAGAFALPKPHRRERFVVDSSKEGTTESAHCRNPAAQQRDTTSGVRRDTRSTSILTVYYRQCHCKAVCTTVGTQGGTPRLCYNGPGKFNWRSSTPSPPCPSPHPAYHIVHLVVHAGLGRSSRLPTANGAHVAGGVGPVFGLRDWHKHELRAALLVCDGVLERPRHHHELLSVLAVKGFLLARLHTMHTHISRFKQGGALTPRRR